MPETVAQTSVCTGVQSIRGNRLGKSSGKASMGERGRGEKPGVSSRQIPTPGASQNDP